MAAPYNYSRCRNTRAAPAPRLPAAPPSTTRSYFSAHAEHYHLTPCSGGAVIPLQPHHSQGRYACQGGVITIPDDGYYMLLWELTVDRVKPTAQLRLGINNSGSMLVSELTPGHDSGQQVTWLNRGSKVSLQVLKSEQGELQGKHAQLTIIRLG
ncbi:MAG: hypothetical protein FWE40_03705 [Oscillospiraceae bacterium]|jgi:hypothetical protein|nr:hypothetical protein [Oscillospiraceae bacterium]